MNLISEYVAYLKDNPQHYWFKAKLYGWGWTPARWQGWVVIAGYLAALFFAFKHFDVSSESGSDIVRPFLISVFLLTALLIGICYATGEKPRWRWGKE